MYGGLTMNERAFPSPDWNGNWSGLDANHGMTLRDWFAGQALVGLAEMYHGSAFDPQGVATSAYSFADAMLVARK